MVIKLPGLKPLDRIAEPAEQHQYFRQFETLEPVTLASHHADIAAISLGPTVPDEVAEAFDRARNAFLYAWFVYEFLSLSEMQAFMALELALRVHFGKQHDDRSPGLNALLKSAITQGLVTDPQAHLKGGIAYTISAWRNIWGHGSANLHDPNITLPMLRTCADIINQLYPSP